MSDLPSCRRTQDIVPLYNQTEIELDISRTRTCRRIHYRWRRFRLLTPTDDGPSDLTKGTILVRLISVHYVKALTTILASEGRGKWMRCTETRKSLSG